MSNILKYQNPSSPLLKPWKALEKMNYEAIPDSTFTRDKTGMGSIEYFSADNNNGITYLNGYHKAHPKPGTDVILYDPATNDQQDVRLDALHFMPKDPIYGALYDEYLLAARDGDVAYNTDKLLQKYIDSNKLSEAFKTYDVKDIGGLRERLFLNEADGLLRNMFIEGTSEYIKSKRYYPDKTQLEQWNAHLMPYINNIKTYLETGVKPEHVIEPAVVTAYKKGGRIHIKKKNRGKFTDYCGGKVTEECIAKGKKSKDPLTRKRANFASVSRKWKHENGGILKAQEGTGNGFWNKLWNAVKEGGMAARDAKLGAIGAQQVRDLYSEGKNQEAQDLAKQYAKANTTGIALAGGVASTGLLGDLLVTGATTAADTFIDGDTENFGKNLSLNAAFDLAGHGAGKLLRSVDWSKIGNISKLFSKSRIDPIFINGKINQAGIQEGLFGGKRSAESFMGSQTYKDAVAHDIALAKRAFGYDINPVVDDRYIKMPVKVEGASLGSRDAGLMYPSPNTNNPADDRILVDVGKHKTVNDLAATIFHENLHHGRFKTIDPQGNTIFTEIYHPEKVNPTLDFYRWKLKHLFKPEVEIPQELLDHYKYLTSVEIPHNEGATNVLELGFLGNARAKSGYPGAQEVQRILDEVRKAYPQHAYTIDLLNMKKPKRVWEALTGQYEDGGKLTDDDYRERVKKFLLWRTVGPEESTYIKNFKM